MNPRAFHRTTTTAVARRLRLKVSRMAEGERLPSERSLCGDFGCSRTTLRSALLDLEGAGLLWRHVGQSTFAGARPAGEPVRPPILLEQTSPSDLMVARQIIEPAVAAAAARGADDADIVRLRALPKRHPTRRIGAVTKRPMRPFIGRSPPPPGAA